MCAHYRLRLHQPRTHRVSPRFNSLERQALITAAHLCELWPGAFAALATDALIHADTGDPRRWLEAVLRANQQLAATGGHLNSYAHHLNSGGSPSDQAHPLLTRVHTAVVRTLAAINNATAAPVTGESAADRAARIAAVIARHRNRRRSGERRDLRINLRFSATEWTALTTTATACGATPGRLAAAATVTAAHATDPRAAIADPRRRLEELLEANRLLAAIGNNLHQAQRHHPPGSPLHHRIAQLLAQVVEALHRADATAAVLAGRLTA